MLSINTEKTKLILVGTSKYLKDSDNFHDLPAIENNLAEFKKVFLNQNIIGGLRENVHVILNEQYDNVLEILVEKSREADDTLIVYYAGHAFLENENHLYLTVPNTKIDMIGYTAIPFSMFKSAIEESAARNKILFLDCCFSGRSLETMTDDKSIILNTLNTRGTFIITATSENQEAIAPKGAKFTAFTGELLQILVEGIDNGHKVLNILDIYNEIKKKFSRISDYPKPRQFNIQDGYTINIAYNRKYYSIINKLKIWNKNVLQTRYREKFSISYYFVREDINSSFIKFLNSDQTVMIITGKAGTGKSMFICGLVDNSPPDVFFYLQDCAHLQLKIEDSIEKYVSQSLELNQCVLDAMSNFLKYNPEKKFVFIFDAVNEFSKKESLLMKLSTFAKNIETQRVKIIITCRTPIWYTLKRHFVVPLSKEFHTAGPNSYTSIDLFAENEIEIVYDLYKRTYNLQTPFEQLSAQVKHFIIQPLFLKLTAESFRKEKIPKTLILQDVFEKYIRKCFGSDGYESREYFVLERIIELMYKHSQGELKLSQLQKDNKIKDYMSVAIDSPFTKLLDEGILTQRETHEGILKKIIIVFITYERVFEYLLGDSILKSMILSADKILEHLEIAREKSFTQLLGAIELAISFAILNDNAKMSIIIELARKDRPDSRQFLCNVIHTIYDSGSRELAELIVFKVSEDDTSEAKLLAVQAAYQLRLDDILISLALSRNPLLRDTATLYLYERWNKARLDGRVDDGYKLVCRLKDLINLGKPRQSMYAFSALIALSLNLIAHTIDDPDSLLPLAKIFQDIVRSVPGLVPDPTKKGFIRFLSEKTFGFFLGAVRLVLAKYSGNLFIFGDLFENPKSKRALLDLGTIITLKDLTYHKDKLFKLITWDNPGIILSSRSVLTQKTYKNPVINLPIIQQIYDEDNLTLNVKSNILYSMIYGLLSRLEGNMFIPNNSLLSLTDNFIELWYEILEFSEKKEKLKVGAYCPKKNVMDSLLFSLVGIFLIESFLMRKEGRRENSKIIRKIIINHELKRNNEINFILLALEKVGYQNSVDFVLLTMLNKNFRQLWENKSFERGLNVIANLRALYQEEVDSILQELPSTNEIWNRVRTIGGFPEPKDLWEISFRMFMVATGINMTIIKLTGLGLLDAVFSKTENNLYKRVLRTIVAVLFEPDRIDIAHVQYGFAHDPAWDLFEVLDIPRSIVNIKPEIHDYYKSLAIKCVELLGRGIFYDEL